MDWKDGNIDGVVVRPAVLHADARGWLAEIFRADDLAPGDMPAMGYVSVTRPGVTRGPHEHAAQTDCFGFLGPGTFRVYLWDQRPASPTRGCRMIVVAGEQRPTVMVVPPGVVHAYRNISERDSWVMNFPNRLYAGKGKKERVDEIRYEDRASSDFPMP